MHPCRGRWLAKPGQSNIRHSHVELHVHELLHDHGGLLLAREQQEQQQHEREVTPKELYQPLVLIELALYLGQ